MDIIYFSKGIRGSLCLAYIIETGYQVKAIVAVNQEDDLDNLAGQYEIPILYPEKLNSEFTAQQLKIYQPDLFILSGYNKILKPLIIDIPPLGTINLHGGKLPEYRGAAPINWQIINGETTGGCSIIYVDEGIDTGEIIAQELYPITPDDTHKSVLEKTLNIFPSLLIKVLIQIENGNVNTIQQDPLEGNYYRRRYPQDSRIDWNCMDDGQVYNLVRGMHGPYPAAYTFRGELKIEINKTKLLDETIIGAPGRILQKSGNGVIILAMNRGLLVEAVSVDGQSVIPSDLFNIGDDLK